MPEPLTPPKGPDQLASFFGVGKDESVSAKQILADVTEARKDGFARRREVNTAVADPDNAVTKQGRELGGALAKGSIQEVGPARMTLVLGEHTAKRLEKTEGTDADAMIHVLREELEELDGGRRDIFKKLDDHEATAAAGIQRRASQQSITALKATLLGVSEQAFAAGEFKRGTLALQAARVDMISAEPLWLTETMADAAGKADIENPDVREVLVNILDGRVLGTTSDMETKAAKEPVETLSNREVVLKKVLEAKAMNQKIEAETLAAKLQAEYEERMKTAWDRKMNLAVADGSNSFKEHFENNQYYAVRFKDYGEGSAYLAGFIKDWKASAEVTNDHNLKGLDGYLQVLENIMEKPGCLDKVIAHASEQSYADLGGRSKTAYEEEGKMGEWSDQIRRQILTEIHGNALGILEGAIEYEGPNMYDQTRTQVLRKSLEVLGRGHALDGLIAGTGELTPEQTLARNVLSEYVTNPVAGQEQRAEQEPGLKDRRLARLRSLKDTASQADIAVLVRQEEVKRTVRLAKEQEDKRREDLKGLVGTSQEHVRAIDDTKEKILDIRAKGARIQELKNAATVEGYITIDRRDKDTSPTLNVSLNAETEIRVAQQVKELKGALEKDPHNRELRDTLAAAEVDAGFFVGMRDWINHVNSSSYKRTVTERGIFKKPKGTILEDAFKGIPDPETDASWYSCETDVGQAIHEAEDAGPEYKTPKKKSLAALRDEVASYTKAENVLDIATQVNQTERELRDRQGEAKRAADALALRADKATTSLAREYVKGRLCKQLRSEGRLSWG